MSAPVPPTCPHIDTVVTFIETLTGEDISQVQRDILLSRMEEIRVANSKLREWGENLELQVKELREQHDSAQSTINDLQNHINKHQIVHL